MLERPILSDDQIRSALIEAYAIEVQSIDFLPLGNDSDAWVYRVISLTGESYFLKARKGPLYEAGAFIPWYLREQGGGAFSGPFSPAVDEPG
jgi:spectinomycin phosphotransferase